MGRDGSVSMLDANPHGHGLIPPDRHGIVTFLEIRRGCAASILSGVKGLSWFSGDRITNQDWENPCLKAKSGPFTAWGSLSLVKPRVSQTQSETGPLQGIWKRNSCQMSQLLALFVSRQLRSRKQKAFVEDENASNFHGVSSVGGVNNFGGG
jgi:hypothetical protein